MFSEFSEQTIDTIYDTMIYYICEVMMCLNGINYSHGSAALIKVCDSMNCGKFWRVMDMK